MSEEQVWQSAPQKHSCTLWQEFSLSEMGVVMLEQYKQIQHTVQLELYLEKYFK